MKIGVVGAGNMGSGIAQKYATEGYQVIVVDANHTALERGRQIIEKMLHEAMQRRVFSEDKCQEIVRNLVFTTDYLMLAGADLVIEAVFEDIEVKRAVFKKLEEICSNSTILATNTSSFYVNDFQLSAKHPERIIGLHYFYHPAKNKLVEVIKGPSTSTAVFEKAWKIQEQAQKIPIESKDAPGFIVNRYFVPWLNEAMRIVYEGHANIPTVEAAAKKAFGIGMGPFELMNVTGVPITLHAATTLENELGAFYAPCHLIKPLVAEKKDWDLSGTIYPEHFSYIEQRLLAVVFYVSSQLVFEEQVCTKEDCDLGARVGLKWRKGPFELMNQVGIRHALDSVEQFMSKYAITRAPTQLRAHAANQTPFILEYVTTQIKDGVGIITFNRPDVMNALDETMVFQLGQAFHSLNNDPKIKGIVLCAKGKAFVAGADTHFFVEQIKSNNIDRIVHFASEGQALFRQIETSPKTVVCAMQGLALGGGLELALACDYIVASPNAVVGFPETGIGIYPGLGGTQRSVRRVGFSNARRLVLCGDIVSASAAQRLNLIDEVIEGKNLISYAMQIALTKPPIEREVTPPLLSSAQDIFTMPLTQLTEVTSPDTDIQKSLKRLKQKSSAALKAADELLQLALSHTLTQGLEAETKGLAHIFSTPGALEGLSSVGR